MKRTTLLKLFCALTALLTAAVLTGCDGGSAPAFDESLIQQVTTGESNGFHYSSFDKRLPDVSFSREFGNDADDPVWLWSDHDMNNAALINLCYDENGAVTAGGTIYSFGDVLSGDGVLLYVAPAEEQADVGFTYLSGDIQYVYAVTAGNNGTIMKQIEIE